MKKVYIRKTKETSLFYQAEVGFIKMGYEIIHYETVPEDITKDDVLIGYIGNVHKALRYLNIEVPQAIDYPEELNWYFWREIKRIESVDEIKIPSFVKPVNFKEFNGRVVREFRDLIGIKDIPMYTSEILDIETEYAVYVINGEIAGIKHYKGNPYISLNKRTVDECISKYKNCPASYRMDFGVTDLSKTIVIEVNDGYSSGNYGLDEITYAKFLLARWEELMKLPEKD